MTITLPLPLPRDWLRIIDAALTNGNYIAVAEALHSAKPQPRDLTEVRGMLPEDVLISFEEVSNAPLHQA
jgi:hypothetical protein